MLREKKRKENEGEKNDADFTSMSRKRKRGRERKRDIWEKRGKDHILQSVKEEEEGVGRRGKKRSQRIMIEMKI